MQQKPAEVNHRARNLTPQSKTMLSIVGNYIMPDYDAGTLLFTAEVLEVVSIKNEMSLYLFREACNGYDGIVLQHTIRQF